MPGKKRKKVKRGRSSLAVDLISLEIPPKVIARIPAGFAQSRGVIPISEEEDVFTVAMGDSLDVEAIDDLRLLLRKPVKAVESDPKTVQKLINKYYGVGADTIEKIVGAEKAGEEKEGAPASQQASSVSEEDLSQDASIIQFVNQIITEAVRERASDIHIEPFADDLRIRYRIDGVLKNVPVPAAVKQFSQAIISRIKIMSRLNIAEKRLTQDGRIEVTADGHELDLRVSVIPTLFGEDIVVRVLDKSSVLFGLEQLKMPRATLEQFNSIILKPHGILLVTGPTGSGKSTTLYAALQKINSLDKKIITIEDPVEYQLKGVNQIQVNTKVGLSFSAGLRAILRHDPDIVMVGEIRDLETAEIAIRASLTGHFVYSTLHTNDAAGAITRLLDMGIEPFLVSSSVEGIMAQRLVRKICTHCKVSYSADAKAIRAMGFPVKGKRVKLHRGKGCPRCEGTGYYGRAGIFELLLINEEIKDLILSRTSTSVIKNKSKQLGMRTLREDGWEKVKSGLSTIDEVMRVTQEEE